MAPEIDPVDDTDDDDPCPIPDDDGNVVLLVPAALKRTEATSGRRPNHGHSKAAGKAAPRRPRANSRKAARKRK